MSLKDKQQRQHAKFRALQHFGVDLSNKEYDDLVSQITNGTAKFIEKQSDRVSVFLVVMRGTAVKAIFDKKRNTIVTFL